MTTLERRIEFLTPSAINADLSITNLIFYRLIKHSGPKRLNFCAISLRLVTRYGGKRNVMAQSKSFKKFRDSPSIRMISGVLIEELIRETV